MTKLAISVVALVLLTDCSFHDKGFSVKGIESDDPSYAYVGGSYLEAPVPLPSGQAPAGLTLPDAAVVAKYTWSFCWPWDVKVVCDDR